MRKFCLLVLFGFLFPAMTILLANGNIEQEAENLYMVRNIEVSKQSTNSLKAKEDSIKEAQKIALRSIFERATIDKSYTKYVNDQTLNEMVESIQIKDEIITKNSYSSKITVLFNKKFLNFHLKKLNIGVGKITYDVFLYIPVMKNRFGKLELMAKNSLWYETAYNNFFDNKYENIFIIDNYSLSNSGLISEKKILEPNYNDFSTVLKKYTANVVVIAIAEYSMLDNSIVVNYKEIDADNIVEKKLTYFNKDGLSYDNLVREVSEKTIEYLSNESKRRVYDKRGDEKNLSKYLRENFVDVIVVNSNLKDYVYMKNLLVNLDFIKKYETLEMTIKYTKIRFYYNGDENEIVSMFKNKGFELRERNGVYFIKYKGF